MSRRRWTMVGESDRRRAQLSASPHSATKSSTGYWSWATGGEAADMCSPQSDPYTKPVGFDFMVARSWSNQVASALHDPCVPVSTATAYFDTAPVLPDIHQFSLAGVTYQANVVRIAVGETRDVELDLFSDSATSAPWKIQIDDYAKLYGGPLELAITLDEAAEVNGEKVYASITPQKRRALHTAE